LDRIGIGKLVTRVLSQQAPTCTDSAESYQAALEALPGLASNWAFVGRQQAGLDLAHRQGLLTVAFNHDADVSADIYIEQFSQLAELLDWQATSEPASLPAKAA
jgi:hypothetical protein